MAQIIMTRAPKVDGSVRKAAFAFLERLMEDDSAAGLHIEKIAGSADSRVRTGRVNDFWRAVLVKLQGTGESASYVYLGTYQHDEAIALAKVASVRTNPRNGVAELIKLPALAQTVTPPEVKPEPAPQLARVEKAKPAPEDVEPLLAQYDVTLDTLLDLGIEESLARSALKAHDETELIDAVIEGPSWQGSALLDLGTGKSVADVKESLSLGAPVVAAVWNDDAILEALRQPAAKMDFAFIGQEEIEVLRAAIEDEDFGHWRVFLHPEQHKYAYGDRSSSFRLTGGAGTGKTVVLVHRAVHLAKQDPSARVILTTFNKTLAASLKDQVLSLDPAARVVDDAGQAGIYIRSVDALARRLLVRGAGRLGAKEGAEGPVALVLGPRSSQVLDVTRNAAWNGALDTAGDNLPADLKSVAFMEAEYATVILPNGVCTLAEYLRVRRPGRGVRLDRATRTAVWAVVESYRAAAAAAGTTDWDEKAMIATKLLDQDAGSGIGRVADHVLVDEGQDLSPARLLLLRAAAESGPNDLFLAEDSQQRIYGQKIVLSKYGINIRGRSRRLTLNYRTTAQNLRYAMSILSDTEFVDMEAEAAIGSGYRSARRGPEPQLVSVGTLAEEYEAVAKLLADWRGESGAPETTGILVRTGAVAEKLQRNLAELGEETRLVIDDNPAEGGRPLIMTMHRAKGMEFRRVILFGLNDDALPLDFLLGKLPEADRADTELKERSLLYVAATRARDVLVVMWNGERSSLLPGA